MSESSYATTYDPFGKTKPFVKFHTDDDKNFQRFNLLYNRHINDIDSKLFDSQLMADVQTFNHQYPKQKITTSRTEYTYNFNIGN